MYPKVSDEKHICREVTATSFPTNVPQPRNNYKYTNNVDVAKKKMLDTLNTYTHTIIYDTLRQP